MRAFLYSIPTKMEEKSFVFNIVRLSSNSSFFFAFPFVPLFLPLNIFSVPLSPFILKQRDDGLHHFHLNSLQ